MSDGTEPIEDEEILYRRIPLQPEYYNPEVSEKATPRSFRPRESDADGLSIFRAKYITPQNIAQNNRGKKYYIAVMKAGDLRSSGMEVVPAPIPPDGNGHALIPMLNYDSRKSNRCEEWQVQLAEHLTIEILGPYPE